MQDASEVLCFFVALHHGERLRLQCASADTTNHIGVVLNGVHHTKTILDKVRSDQAARLRPVSKGVTRLGNISISSM